MLAGLPVVQRRLVAGGVDTAVLEAGTGPPLVLLHGGIECGGAYWAPVLASLAQHHHVVVPDAPGLGESAPVQRLDTATFARWFGDVLAETNVRRPTLVSHSLLGSLSARYAVEGGGGLAHLVLYGAPGIGPYRMPMALRYAAIRFGIRPTARNAERFDRVALVDLDATRRRDPHFYAAFDSYTRARAGVGHVKRTMRRLVATETKQIPDEALARIPVRTSLIWGRGDRMVPLGLAERAATVHGWPMQTVENAGHVPHLEQPDDFVQKLSTLESAMTGQGEKR